MHYLNNCKEFHSNCNICPKLISASNLIITHGIMQLSLLFKSSFPGITYHSLSAKRQLMQMPLVTLRLGKPSSGTSVTYVMEYFPNVNYCQFLHVLSRFHHCPTKQGFGMSKDELKEVLKLASSDKERECIRYTAFRASGLSSTRARCPSA